MGKPTVVAACVFDFAIAVRVRLVSPVADDEIDAVREAVGQVVKMGINDVTS